MMLETLGGASPKAKAPTQNPLNTGFWSLNGSGCYSQTRGSDSAA